MPHKHEHLESSLDRALREVFAKGFSDPRISGLVTITSVKISPDHAHAFVGISVLPAEKSALTMHGLESAARHIRREVGDLIRTRQMPDLTFRLDTSLKDQAKVLSALDKAREEVALADEGRGTWTTPKKQPADPVQDVPGAKDSKA